MTDCHTVPVVGRQPTKSIFEACVPGEFAINKKTASYRELESLRRQLARAVRLVADADASVIATCHDKKLGQYARVAAVEPAAF